jgi:hypothetical protein
MGIWDNHDRETNHTGMLFDFVGYSGKYGVSESQYGFYGVNTVTSIVDINQLQYDVGLSVNVVFTIIKLLRLGGTDDQS